MAKPKGTSNRRKESTRISMLPLRWLYPISDGDQGGALHLRKMPMKAERYYVHTAPNGKQYLIKTGPRGSRRNMGEVEDSAHALKVVATMHNNRLARRPQNFDLSPLPLWSDAQRQQELF
jgi:hypothetical protein